jgi:hypothetical protein
MRLARRARGPDNAIKSVPGGAVPTREAARSSDVDNLIQVRVHCYRGQTRLASYDLPVPVPMDPTRAKWPSTESFVNEAKNNLTMQGLAQPPYTGITFDIER